LDGGFEICRSLWNRDALVADFDIEQLLPEYAINPLHVPSGRGHHFVWRIEQSSEEFKELSALGRAPLSLWETESERHPPNDRPVPREPGRAFAGLGLCALSVWDRLVCHGLIHIETTAAPCIQHNCDVRVLGFW